MLCYGGDQKYEGTVRMKIHLLNYSQSPRCYKNKWMYNLLFYFLYYSLITTLINEITGAYFFVAFLE